MPQLIEQMKSVESYIQNYPYISLIRTESNGVRSFASKAKAFQKGYEYLKDRPFEFIGNLDADVNFNRFYFKDILEEFKRNQELGVAGGLIIDRVGEKYRPSQSGPQHVAGAVQLFRRECFEEICGYRPLSTGGIDSFALIKARMKGWETKMVRQALVFHNRPEGTAVGSLLRARFRQGKTDHNLGVNIAFAMLKAIGRLKEKPLFVIQYNKIFRIHMAICLLEQRLCHLSLRTSLIFRMENLLPAIVTSCSFYRRLTEGFSIIQRRHIITSQGWRNTSESGGGLDRNRVAESIGMRWRNRAE